MTDIVEGSTIIGILNKSSEVASIISESECGYISSPGDVDMLVDEIQQLYSNKYKVEKMGFNARREFEKKYSKEIGVNKHITLVNSVLSGNIQ